MNTAISHLLQDFRLYKPKPAKLLSPYVYPGLVKGSVRAPSVMTQPEVICDRVARRTAMFFGFDDTAAMKGRSRKYSIVEPRQISMFIIRKKGVILADIARYFNRDHTTVIHSYEVVKMQMEADSEYRDMVQQVEDYILSTENYEHLAAKI